MVLVCLGKEAKLRQVATGACVEERLLSLWRQCPTRSASQVPVLNCGDSLSGEEKEKKKPLEKHDEG